MNNTLRSFFAILILVVIFDSATDQSAFAQSSFTFKAENKTFVAKEMEAALVDINNEKVIQIRVANADKIAYLYLKYASIKDIPSSLKYIEHDEAKGKSSESEIIWVPDGPDNPQWNSVKGKTVITKFDLEKKLISGTFEFKVEKFEYSSEGNGKRPSMEIAEGQFSDIQYR